MLQHRINIVIDQNNELLEKSRLKKNNFKYNVANY